MPAPKGKNLTTKAAEAEREQRRAKVAANLLAGLSYRDIAEALDVSLSTVAGDAKLILNRWKKEQVSTVDRIRQVEDQRLQRAVNALWPKILAGDCEAIETYRKLAERRAKLLGLDAPTKTTVTINSLDQLLELLPEEVAEALLQMIAQRGEGEDD